MRVYKDKYFFYIIMIINTRSGPSQVMIQQCARKKCKAKRAGVHLMICAVLDCSSCDGVRPGKHCVHEQVKGGCRCYVRWQRIP